MLIGRCWYQSLLMLIYIGGGVMWLWKIFVERKLMSSAKFLWGEGIYLINLCGCIPRMGSMLLSQGTMARKVLRKNEGVGSSSGASGQQVWKKIWQLHVPNKIENFGWRACQDILPTWVNLVWRKIIAKSGCQCCTWVPKSTLYAIWECGVAQDVWAGCAISL